jgi:hypothetical protein
MLLPYVPGQSGTANPAFAVVTKPPSANNGKIASAFTHANLPSHQTPGFASTSPFHTKQPTHPEANPSTTHKAIHPATINPAEGTSDASPPAPATLNFDPITIKFTTPATTPATPPETTRPPLGTHRSPITTPTTNTPSNIGPATDGGKWWTTTGMCSKNQHTHIATATPNPTVIPPGKGERDGDWLVFVLMERVPERSRLCC